MPPTPRSSRTNPGGSPSLTILIADDDVTNRTILESMLRKDGHRVVQACDGKEAITRFREHTPDLVLMDVMMPGLDGYGATRRLRDSMGDRYVPIVFLTGMTDEEALIRCFESGGDGFLTKPYSRALLRAHLAAHDRRRSDVARRSEALDTMRAERDGLANGIDAILDHTSTNEGAGSLRIRTVGASTSRPGANDGTNLRDDRDRVVSVRCPDGRRFVFVGTLEGVDTDPRPAWVAVTTAIHATIASRASLGDTVVALEDVLRRALPGATCRAAFAMLDPATGELATWCGGGAAIVVRAQDGSHVERTGSHELSLCAGDPDPRCERRLLKDGDRVTLVSATLLDTADADGSWFGIERLEAAFARSASDAPADALDAVARSCETFATGTAPAAGTLVELTPAPDVDPSEATEDATDADEALTRLCLELDTHALRKNDPLPDLLDWIDRFPETQPHRATIGTILCELLANALDHGILGLDTSRKAEPGGFAAYLAARDRALDEMRDGWIGVSLALERLDEGGRLEVIVTDSGNGFDADASPAEPARPDDTARGRGLSLVRSLCTHFRVCDPGNRAEAVFDWGA